MRDDALSVGVVGQIMGVSDEQARSVVENLVGDGFLRSVRLAESYHFRIRDDEDGAAKTKNAFELRETTIAGDALAMPRLGTPMPRPKAQTLLDGLISCSATVNEDSASAFTVERIEVFDSFAEPSRGEVGEVDVAFCSTGVSKGTGHVEPVPLEQAGLPGPGPVAAPFVATRGETLRRERIPPVEDGTELLGFHWTFEADIGGEAAHPSARKLTVTGVAILRRGGDLAQLVVGGAGAEPPDVQP